jgi:hypothetical protein
VYHDNNIPAATVEKFGKMMGYNGDTYYTGVPWTWSLFRVTSRSATTTYAFVAASLAPEDQNRYFERTGATPVRHDRPEPLPPPWWRASAPPLPRISAMDTFLPKPHGSDDLVYSRHFVGFIHSGNRDRPSSEKCIRKTRSCQDVAREAGVTGQQTHTCVA